MNEDFEILLEKLDSAHYYNAGYIVSLCPFHSESRPSFFIYEDTYRCASCNRWGKTSELTQRLSNLHVYPHQEQSYLFNPFSKWLKDNRLDKVLELAYKNCPSKYLENRGISKDVQRNLRIGLLDGWITFPIISDKHTLVGAVARAGEGNNSKSKYVLPYKQDANLLYVPSWHRITTRDIVYLTFGIIDAVTLYAAGFAAASTTTGKRISPSAFDIIRKQIIFIPDEGETAEALKIAAKLGWRGKVKSLKYPDGCKDLNDVVWKAGYSLDKLKEMIK